MDGEAPNHSILREVALALEPILDSLTFVGGQVVELLITDPVAVSIRATLDVDAVVPAASTAEYRRVGERLVELGFRGCDEAELDSVLRTGAGLPGAVRPTPRARILFGDTARQHQRRADDTDCGFLCRHNSRASKRPGSS